MLAALVLSVITLGSAAQEPDLDTVLSRATEYVHNYHRDLGMVIAREVYVQSVPVAGSADLPAAPGLSGAFRNPMRLESQDREMVSDYMMVRLPGEGDQWTGFRAIVEVDGRTVVDRVERIQGIFEGSAEEAVDRWRKLSQESARYNIGAVNRNTNVPTFALLVLEGANPDSFEFERVDNDRVDDLDVWVIAYRETASPTLITGRRGEDVAAHGRLWIDPADGRVVRTEVKTGDEKSELRSEVTVRYRLNPDLDIWVPRDMKERYNIGEARIDATAKYSDFQRFNVSVDTDVDTDVPK